MPMEWDALLVFGAEVLKYGQPFLPNTTATVHTGACVTEGGHVWWGGMCGRWACMAGGMHGRGYACQGAYMAGGHAWQGGMYGKGVCMTGACMTGGMCGGGAWQERQPLQWKVCILLECILVVTQSTQTRFIRI